MDPVERLREGYENAEDLIFEWPADFPYGPPVPYEGDVGLFDPEEQEKPLSELQGGVGTKDAAFEALHPRDRRGRFISGPDAITDVIANYSEEVAESRRQTQERIDRGEAAPGALTPGEVIPVDEQGLREWETYLSPVGYQGIQAEARRERSLAVTPGWSEEGFSKTDLIERLITQYGESRRGAEGWRVTSLRHMPPESRRKLERGEPVRLREPGFLSVGQARAPSETVGSITHPGADLAVLHVKVNTSTPALDVRQKPREHIDPEVDPEEIVGEWDFPPGTEIHFTGESYQESRAVALNGELTEWEIKPVTVYEVEIR
jgi:hypothetical protein